MDISDIICKKEMTDEEMSAEIKKRLEAINPPVDTEKSKRSACNKLVKWVMKNEKRHIEFVTWFELPCDQVQDMIDVIDEGNIFTMSETIMKLSLAQVHRARIAMEMDMANATEKAADSGHKATAKGAPSVVCGDGGATEKTLGKLDKRMIVANVKDVLVQSIKSSVQVVAENLVMAAIVDLSDVVADDYVPITRRGVRLESKPFNVILDAERSMVNSLVTRYPANPIQTTLLTKQLTFEQQQKIIASHVFLSDSFEKMISMRLIKSTPDPVQRVNDLLKVFGDGVFTRPGWETPAESTRRRMYALMRAHYDSIM